MARFRQSSGLNVLYATRVGAEGLDFGRCGLVVLFDVPNHVQEYLQCRYNGVYLYLFPTFLSFGLVLDRRIIA